MARVGTPHCPKCGKEIKQQTIDQIIDQVLSLPEGTRIQVMAPVIRGKKGEHTKIFEDAKRSGYVRARVDGNLYELDEEIKLEKNKKHNIEIVVDRLIIRPDIQQRLTDSVETASGLTGGLVVVNLLREERDLTFSQNYACEDCGISIEELTPRMFSFNNPFGACPTCTGLGSQLKVDPELIVPDKSLSILEGAIQASGWNNIRGDGISRMYFDALAKKYHFSLTDPWETLPEDVRSIILYGTGGEKLELHYDQPRGKGVLYQPFEGICNNVERRYQETQSDASKRELEELMDHFQLSGGSATDFRPVFAHVEQLLAQGAFTRLRGLIYFTDGMGIYPKKRPPYETAFVMMEDPAIRVGEPDSYAGRICVVYAGVTGGGANVYKTFFDYGVGTLVMMHMPEDDIKAVQEQNKGNVIIAGHMGSDSIGFNRILDAWEAAGLEVTRTGGIVR